MHVERTPTIGEKGSIFLTDFGNLAFASMPTTMGRRTTCGAREGRRRREKVGEGEGSLAKAHLDGGDGDADGVDGHNRTEQHLVQTRQGMVREEWAVEG